MDHGPFGRRTSQGAPGPFQPTQAPPQGPHRPFEETEKVQMDHGPFGRRPSQGAPGPFQPIQALPQGPHRPFKETEEVQMDHGPFGRRTCPLWHSGPDPRFGPKVDDRAFEGRFDLAFVGSFVAFRRLFCSSVAVLLFCCWTAWIPFGDHPLKLERYRED